MEAEKSLVCFFQKQELLQLPLLSSEVFLHALPPQQTDHFYPSWTPDLATALNTKAVDVANIREDPDSKLQWGELKVQKVGIRQTLKTGTTNWGSFTLAVFSFSWSHAVGQHEAGGLQWHFYVITESLQQEEIYFGIALQSKVSWHTEFPACLPQEMLLGQGEELEGSRFADIHTGWATWLKIIRTISFLSWENSFYLPPFQFLACQPILLTIHPPLWSPCV